MDSLGYRFKNKELLKVALTHSSYGNEKHCKCNERLEFLGDSVLSIIVSDYLFRNMPAVDEGDLSKTRASLVCEQSLAEFAKKISLGDKLLLGKGEEAAGGRARASILSDAFEAVLAAIYLDSGIEAARKWILNLMAPALKLALKGKTYHDYKTILQEEVQKKGGRVTYRVTAESGPDHHKDFEVEVFIDEKKAADGSGMSKKDAEQNAAKRALVGIGYEIL
jgi:ribonuclease-3